MAPRFELVLACDLIEYPPQQVIDILTYLVTPDEEKPKHPPSPVPHHPFFQEWRWWDFLNKHCYYFPGQPFSNLTLEKNHDYYMFTIRTMIRRNADQIEAFLDWIATYSQTNGFVGYTRCDEIEEIDLIYFEDSYAYYNAVKFYKNPPTISRRK